MSEKKQSSIDKSMTSTKTLQPGARLSKTCGTKWPLSRKDLDSRSAKRPPFKSKFKVWRMRSNYCRRDWMIMCSLTMATRIWRRRCPTLRKACKKPSKKSRASVIS